jgi:serine protease Do
MSNKLSNRMSSKTFARSTIAAAVLATMAAGYAQFGAFGVTQAEATASTAPVAAVTVPLGGKSATDFSGIVARYGPAVVNIDVTAKAQQVPTMNMPGNMQDGPFSEFFERFGIPAPEGIPMQPGQRPQRQGQGSGFIVSADGLILTNAHVVDGADEVKVKLTDRREFEAKVLGVDRMTDVAVLKIKAENLPVVKLGNPHESQVGEPVLAIGSPYGFENTATSGIISAKSRSMPGGTYVPFLQTDVAVNPGNSGGPLFNLKGEVIGINSQIFSRTGGYQGLSFAIPIDVATSVQQQLVAHGKVTRGRLGVTIQEVNQALGSSFGLKSLQGALISAVEDGSPADKAGLKTGDVVLRIGDKEISHSNDLAAQVAAMKPGTKTELEVIRDGKRRTLTATIGEMKGNTQLASNDAGGTSQGKLGVAVRPLGEQEQSRNDVEGGLLVQDASGPAARAGIQAGDIIVSVNGKPLASVEELQQILDKAGKHVALLVQRNEARIFVPVEIG